MKTKMNRKIKLALLGTSLLAVCLLSLCLGSIPMSPIAALRALLFSKGQGTASLILRYVRLPRLCGAVLAGVGLSLSGLLLQSLTDNAMASPSLIGVNAGAGFFVILALALLPLSLAAVPVFAFFGALLATALILALGIRMKLKKITVVLTGLAVNAVFNAGISLLSLLDGDALVYYNAFSIGSLAGVGMERLLLPALFILLAFFLALLLSHPLTLLSLGDATAATLGVSVKRTRALVMLAASLASAAAVSFAGLLGFVGLMAPHIARRLFGGSFRALLCPTLLIGALLVALSDLLGRTILAPTELPVGIFMALLGAPFFLVLLLKGGEGHAEA